ncbi:Accessory gene regulator protein B [Moorella humiferrea]|uniref:accessory gene regulator ArgB-like protein n=1 Tax=Neomoorella humiferrea TaxID=676965 RepID=UPI0030D44E8D
MLHNLSLRLAKYLSFNGGLDPSRITVIAYGLEIILGIIVKTFCFLAIPSVLGVLPQTLAAFTASALFRLPPGGAHCTGFARCLFGCIVAFTAIGILARFIGRLGDWTLTLFYIVLGLAILLTLSQVPVDNPSRPVKKLEERVRMQKWALGILFAYFMLVNILTFTSDLIFAASLGLLLQLFTLLPAGYKLMHHYYMFLIKVTSSITKGRW